MLAAPRALPLKEITLEDGSIVLIVNIETSQQI
jgi:hypothetical protein